jgi:hypothetical protein
LTNAVITWTTEYYEMAVGRLRADCRDIPDELLAHISPTHSENVNFFGTITVDVEAEPANLDECGLRPLQAFGTGRPVARVRSGSPGSTLMGVIDPAGAGPEVQVLTPARPSAVLDIG